jgi:(E)-4-hydroxy-3-methylbut-2-enyl-diphosphate synthase
MDFSRVENVQMEDLKNLGHFYLPLLDKWNMNDLGSDFIYSGDTKIPFMLPNGLKEILNYNAWQAHEDQLNKFPLLSGDEYLANPAKLHTSLNFIKVNYKHMNDAFYTKVKNDPSVVLIVTTTNLHAMAALRRLFFYLMENEVKAPVIIQRQFENMPEAQLQLYASTDVGGLLVDGLGDGILLSTELNSFPDKSTQLNCLKTLNSLSFGILQAARTRMSKTEYISCPSCGRTLFDLQETTAMIRKRTDHLKGIKIGIMGCIVNGPGEMADADYGYVGVGKDKIALYRGQNVVKKAVPSDKAVDELIELIREDGKWLEITPTE